MDSASRRGDGEDVFVAINATRNGGTIRAGVTMAVYETQMIACALCKEVTPHQVQKANHGLHFVLTLLTMGLWLFVWVFAAAGGGAKKCQKCALAAQQKAIGGGG